MQNIVAMHQCINKATRLIFSARQHNML